MRAHWASAAILGGLIFLGLGCASAPPPLYSLEDREIFIAPRPYRMNVAVALLADRRPPEEVAWGGEIGRRSELSPDIPSAVTDRLVKHLRISSVFNEVVLLGGAFDPSPSAFTERPVPEGVDAILVGSLSHYFGKSGPDRQIEGRVMISEVRLFGRKSGRTLWEGQTDKRLRREEVQPRRDADYAGEALRGAINLLAIQLADGPLSPPEEGAGTGEGISRGKVGILLPEDRRPLEEREAGVRRLLGDPDYSLYSDNIGAVDLPIACGIFLDCATSEREPAPFVGDVARMWVAGLRSAHIFDNVFLIQTRAFTTEELREWAGEGLDLVLVSELTRSTASVVPYRGNAGFPILSGGIAYPRRLKASAMTQIQNIRLIETRTGEVIWEGEAEFGFEREISRWESPMKIVKESIEGTLHKISDKLSKISYRPGQE